MPASDELPFATTLLVRDTCWCLHAQRAARALARRYDEALRPFGLTSGQFSLLMSLNRPRPPSIGEVSALLAMDRTTLTSNLKPLERRALLEVVTGVTDRRIRLLRLMPAGRAALIAAMPAWQRTQATIGAMLGKTHPDRLRQQLRDLS